MPSEAEIEAAALAIDAHWSDQDARRMDFYATEATYQDHCRSTARAALSAASAVRSEPGPRIKPEIITALREWAEFEQDGGNVEQGAAIDIILDWYDRALLSQEKANG